MRAPQVSEAQSCGLAPMTAKTFAIRGLFARFIRASPRQARPLAARGGPLLERARESIHIIAPDSRRPSADRIARLGASSSDRGPAGPGAVSVRAPPRRTTRHVRDQDSPRAAAARHRGLPAHGGAAVRRPREVGPRPRRGDARRQADPAGHPDATATRTIPTPKDIFDVGVLANVLQLLKLPDGTVKVLVEGKSPRRGAALHRTRRVLRSRGRRGRGGRRRGARGRGAVAARWSSSSRTT